MQHKKLMTLLIIVLVINLIILAVYYWNIMLPRRIDTMPVPRLLSAKGQLAEIAQYVNAPVSRGGSIDNLTHFLLKEPGREEFSSRSDRRRARQYILELSPQITQYRQLYSGYGSVWTPDFLSVTRALFEQVKKDIFNITGYPEVLTVLQNPTTSNEHAATPRLLNAISEFGTSWVPAWKDESEYNPETQQIKRYLSKNLRFSMRMNKIDKSWKNLIAELYNLFRNSSWKIAVAYDSSLHKELDELIQILLSGDIIRRVENLLEGIPGLTEQDAELRWSPDMTFFKNLPELTGQTKDDNLIVFSIKLNLGYSENDPHTRIWISNYITWITDYCRKYFSDSVYDRLVPTGTNSKWQISRLKAELIHNINSQIVLEKPFGGRTFGLRDIAFVRLQFSELE